jgi:hypothetical protein
MVCQRSRDRKGPKNFKNLPAKKRPITTPLTKESLEAITGSPTTTKPAAVSVRSDDGSTESNGDVSEASYGLNIAAFYLTSSLDSIPRRITDDAAVAHRAIQIRNEEECMRVAKALLYENYLRALQAGEVNK